MSAKKSLLELAETESFRWTRHHELLKTDASLVDRLDELEADPDGGGEGDLERLRELVRWQLESVRGTVHPSIVQHGFGQAIRRV